jgi:hypothetical protein
MIEKSVGMMNGCTTAEFYQKSPQLQAVNFEISNSEI